MCGAFAGGVLVWLYFLPHWRETKEPDSKLACFCTAPAIRNFAANMFSEIVGTLILVVVVGAIFSKAVAATGPAAALGPYLVAALVWGIGRSLRRNDQLCDQSGARPWSALRPRVATGSGQRQFGLGLCDCACVRSADRRNPRRPAFADDRFVAVHRFVRLLIDRRRLRNPGAEQHHLSLNQLLACAVKTWHGVKIGEPDWSFCTQHRVEAHMPDENVITHVIFNAY